MVFSSFLFLFYFLPITLAAYYGLPIRWRLSVLTLCSYLFYGWTNPLYVPLMWLSTTIDYIAGAMIASEAQRKGEAYLMPEGPRTNRQCAALIMSVVSNLALLGYFKYFQFGAESYQSLLRVLGYSEFVSDSIWHVTLPLGISFYTFQSLSYTIDIYRGDVRPARSFLNFACYVSLFPQLVAGPIVRFQDLADQLKWRRHTWEKFARGVILFELGLAKKVMLANPCGFIAEQAFNAGTLECQHAWWGLIAYSLQIYFDFSGYSDMALGLGLMFGFVFPENFKSPYCSTSMTEFWRRWHMTLSTWLREYLYIPLGGNRLGPLRTYLNLFIVMLLGGLWHGAAWNFLIWGGYHGILLAVERFVRERKWITAHLTPAPARFDFSRIFRIGATCLLVSIGWVLFRAHDLNHAVTYFLAMLGLAETRPTTVLLSLVLFPPYHVLCVIAGLLITWIAPTTWDFTQHLTLTKALWGKVCFLFSIVLLATQQYNPFIYFLF